jgi:heme O synthase-like polyprenyltransferase
MRFVGLASIDLVMVGVWMVVSAVVFMAGAMTLAHIVERHQGRRMARHKQRAPTDSRTESRRGDSRW